MYCPNIYQALCVRVTLIIMLTGSATAFHLWSRLRNAFIVDTTLYKRDIKSHYTNMTDPVHGVKMGIPNTACDDGVHGISTDWEPGDTSVLLCKPEDRYHLKLNSGPLNIIEQLLPAHHMCLDKEIKYPNFLPLNGNHRPLWPQFGEYVYLPPQRWVHSLEHGAVVLLYHPCMFGSADLTTLKNLLKTCLSKHIIAPYRHIPHHMPFALLAFRHARLLSNAKDTAEVTQFIKNYAMSGPETHVTKDGQYRAGLIHGVPEVINAINCPQL